MKYEYWMNDLNEIYSYNNFLKNINESKIFDNIKYDFTNIDEIEKLKSQRDISFFEFYTSQQQQRNYLQLQQFKS